MTNAEIGTMLRSTGLPVFYDHAKQGAKLPYITYTTSTDNFHADNKTYQKITAIRAVLYTSNKSSSLEATLEAVLDANDLPWDRDEVYEASSEVFMEIYESEVV